MRYETRPLVAWTDPETKTRRSTSRFRASWQDTLEFLSAEIEKVGGNLQRRSCERGGARGRVLLGLRGAGGYGGEELGVK